MHYCVAAVADVMHPDPVRMARADPPPLAYGKLALLSRTLTESGATLLPAALKTMPRFAGSLVLDPENCVYVGCDDNAIRAVKKYSVREDGPRFSLRYTFVPKCPSDGPDPEPIVPDWVHPSLLEPDPPREAGVKVHGRVFPYDELHKYCARGMVNSIKYQAEDKAYDTPRVHVRLSRFGSAEEKMIIHLLHAHIDHRLTVDACCVEGGAKWYRFTSLLHCRAGFEKLKFSPRLFTTTGRGGLRGVYERLLRKHVLFYFDLARGVKESAFRQMEAEDVGEVWDKYGANNAAFVRAVTKDREEKCTAPLLWTNIWKKERDPAHKMLGKMPWASPVMKPAILTKISWRRQHARANAAKASCAGLSVPQIRNCNSPEQMNEETLHYFRYPYDRKPILITDATERVPNAEDYEGIIYLRPEGTESSVVEESKSVYAAVDACDAQHIALLVQWFPLLFAPSLDQQDSVHPRTAARAIYYSAKCQEKARVAAARMEDEHGKERRDAEEEMKKFERLAAEFDALTVFAYPGCHAGCD
jgi:hypothetical protein